VTALARTFRRHPRWYLAGALLLVILIVVAVLVAARSAGPAPETAVARVDTLSRTVAVTGTLEPSQRADLDFPAGGQVATVDVEVGQEVTAGQVLASVDAASLPGQVAQAESSLASARARLTADRDADASSAQIDADQAAIDAAQAQLDVARQNAAEATLTAPFAGTVAAVNVTVGERVSAGGSGVGSGGGSAAASAGAGAAGAASAASAASAVTTGAEAAVVVVSTGSYVVDATVDDTQVGLLEAGQVAGITPSGAATPVPGAVASVGLVATSTSGVASYPVTLTVTGSPPGLHLGSSAQAEITIEEIPDVLLVPTAAVRGSGAETSVVVLERGTEVTRPVTVGAASGGRTQITTGLVSGEQVVLPAAQRAPATGGFGGPR
jgi:membrane fusion protein, macrolide-specific efflux system